VVIATLAAVTLLAAACGDDGDDDAAPQRDDESPNVTLAAEGAPRAGGRLIYGLFGETDGWDPTRNRWGPAGTIVGMAIYDPLAAFDEDGDWAPYLAESIEPNDDYTVWTITLREGVTFHNGEPLDSVAIQRTVQGHLDSPLTAPAFAPLERVETPDALTAVIHLNSPWAALPVGLTGQAGMVAAPSQLDDPASSSLQPVGTGPFRFVEWLPDNRLVVERYDDYWRTDDDGTQLPYLDGIEFRPMPDDDARLAAMRTGDIDMTYSSSTSAIERYRDLAADGTIQLVQQEDETAVQFVMLNHARPPFDDLNARLALAHATNRDQWVEVIGQGKIDPATTLFRPGSRWHSDVPFPEFDLDRARQYVDAYEAEHGRLAFKLSALSTPVARSQAELLKEMWDQAGMQVDIGQTDAASYILDGVLGDYQAVVWAQFASPDPDYEHVWWDADHAKPLGELSLNFPRSQDEQIDEALDRARATADFDTRFEAYEVIQERFAATLPYVWLSYTNAIIVAQNDVRGITNGPLPDGRPSRPMGGPGSFSLATRVVQLWFAE
jgi:peptide/nickel transport system substrate-binding protein